MSLVAFQSKECPFGQIVSLNFLFVPTDSEAVLIESTCWPFVSFIKWVWEVTI